MPAGLEGMLGAPGAPRPMGSSATRKGADKRKDKDKRKQARKQKRKGRRK